MTPFPRMVTTFPIPYTVGELQMKVKNLLIAIWLISLHVFAGYAFNSSDALALKPGAILYRTSGGNEMPGRVGVPTSGELNAPYLQIPCGIYLNGKFDNPEIKTGHVALYIGEVDNGKGEKEHMIIEAGGNYDPFLPEITP